MYFDDFSIAFYGRIKKEKKKGNIPNLRFSSSPHPFFRNMRVIANNLDSFEENSEAYQIVTELYDKVHNG